jgi:hypothetical protein
MVAVKSLRVAFGLASVKVATVTVPVEIPSVALTFAPAAASAASAIVTTPLGAICVPSAARVIVTTAEPAPSSA